MTAPRTRALAGRDVLELVRPGLQTTVQDLGRPGHGRFGVSPAGAMDPLAHRIANALCSNRAEAPALELYGPGATVRFLAATTFALAGADLGATLDDQALPALHVGQARAGATLHFLARRHGARASLAIEGGLLVPQVLGSAAMDLAAGLGPFDGRALRAGTRLAAPLASARTPPENGPTPPGSPELAHLGHHGPTTLRYLPEPDGGAAPAHTAFTSTTFRVAPRSNRTGLRFEGPALPTTPDPDRVSEPTAPGTLQLPPDGLPILLLADRNTTGGYPRLGYLASVDRPAAAQLWPGDPVRFVAIDSDQARAALAAQAAAVAALVAHTPG